MPSRTRGWQQTDIINVNSVFPHIYHSIHLPAHLRYFVIHETAQKLPPVTSVTISGEFSDFEGEIGGRNGAAVKRSCKYKSSTYRPTYRQTFARFIFRFSFVRQIRRTNKFLARTFRYGTLSMFRKTGARLAIKLARKYEF